MNESVDTFAESLSFHDRHREFQYLVRELVLLREHNHRRRDDASQSDLLLFAEGAMVLVVLERFLRIVLGTRAQGQTLPGLIGKAVADGELVLPAHFKDYVVRIRNTLIHGNYEAAAKRVGCDVDEYFPRYFASEIEDVYNLVDGLVMQIDPYTGVSLAKYAQEKRAELLGLLKRRTWVLNKAISKQ